MKVLTICGSLRSHSVNAALVRALPAMSPAGTHYEEASIRDLPLYDDDVSDHPAVLRFRAQVTAADAVLIVSPEYNFGIPGPLKNALDWASRPAYKSPFHRKPVGMMGASIGVVGTARMQGQLKQVLLGMASEVFPFPEVLVGTVAKKFDTDLNLVDDETRAVVTRYLGAFSEWVGSRRSAS